VYAINYKNKIKKFHATEILHNTLLCTWQAVKNGFIFLAQLNFKIHVTSWDVESTVAAHSQDGVQASVKLQLGKFLLVTRCMRFYFFICMLFSPTLFLASSLFSRWKSLPMTQSNDKRRMWLDMKSNFCVYVFYVSNELVSIPLRIHVYLMDLIINIHNVNLGCLDQSQFHSVMETPR
jgi:hypothetical protein